MAHGARGILEGAMPKLDGQALSAFVERKAKIDALLSSLSALSDDHFGVMPDEVHWGHVGSLEECRALLERALGLAPLIQSSASSK
jgi:hypothetical protein